MGAWVQKAQLCNVQCKVASVGQVASKGAASKQAPPVWGCVEWAGMVEVGLGVARKGEGMTGFKHTLCVGVHRSGHPPSIQEARGHRMVAHTHEHVRTCA